MPPLRTHGQSQILAMRKVTLKDKFINALFEKGHKMVVLVQGESVKSISIIEADTHEFNQKIEGEHYND